MADNCCPSMAVLRTSVLLCTHNRSALLSLALESLESQTLPREDFEVVVVDNASTDDTRQVVEGRQASTSLDLRYIHEPRLGLCVARNRGIRESRGEWITFFDDDALAEKDWLEELMATAGKFRCSVVGGRILPNWEDTRPTWLVDEFMRYLIVLDLGPHEHEVHDLPFFYGTNVTFHRKVFQELGEFREDLDRVGTVLMGGGDTELCLRAHRAGKRLMYSPKAVVRHWISRERLQKSFFRTRFYYSGRARAAHSPGSFPMRLGMSLALAAGTLALAFPILGSRLVGLETTALRLERYALLAVGYLHHQLLEITGRLPRRPEDITRAP
jgi:glycosyltransferase involved in cell wall biosynthesis